MKKIIFAACIAMASCSSLQVEDSMIESKSGIQFSVKDYILENETKTTSEAGESGVTFKWVNGDLLGVFSSYDDYSGSQVKFANKRPGETSTACFDGAGWSFDPAYTYVAYYPYNAVNEDLTAIPVSYSALTQTENGSAAHIAQNDFIYATNTVSTGGIVNFDFNHLSTVLRVQMTLPVTATLTNIALVAESDLFATSGTINISTGVFNALATTSTISLQLDNIEINSTNSYQLTAWFILAPVDLSSEQISVVATDSYGNDYEINVAGKNMLSGKAYRITDTANEIFEYIDLGLPSGTLWANMNVGASCHTDYGNYYTWGSTTPAQGTSCNLSDYWDWTNIGGSSVEDLNKLNNIQQRTYAIDKTKSSYTINQYEIGENYSISGTARDAAYIANSSSQMPSFDQIEEIVKNTITSVVSDGILITSKTNGNSIIMPLGGWYACGKYEVKSLRFSVWGGELHETIRTGFFGDAVCMGGEAAGLLLNKGSSTRFYALPIRPVKR